MALRQRLLLHSTRNYNVCRRDGHRQQVYSARSPQSNGMAEALVKTFKRDYVFCNDRPDAETVMAQLSGWFEDYNENAPHKALRMLSPREFIRSLQNLECPV